MNIDQQLCKGCELCILACPRDALQLSESTNTLGYKYVTLIDNELCTECIQCAIICPDLVITFSEEGGG